MKIRYGFISNSSSTSFIITNKTDQPLLLDEFVIENRHLINEFNQEYHADARLCDMLCELEESSEVYIEPGPQVMIFGDENGTTLGRVYDYILRSGGESERFMWELKEYLR